MKTRKKRPVVVMGLVGMMSVVFLLYVWGKVDYVRVGYELDALSHRKAVLQRKNDQLQLDQSRLTALNRIAAEANARLGLSAPKPGQVVLVAAQPSEGVTVPSPSDQNPVVAAAHHHPEGR